MVFLVLFLVFIVSLLIFIYALGSFRFRKKYFGGGGGPFRQAMRDSKKEQKSGRS